MKAQADQLRYLDLSGYAFSGKHAVIDLVREFRGYEVAPFEFEFNLIRVQGGVRDLESALVDDWSPIRSDAGIRRFQRLTRLLAGSSNWRKPSTWVGAVGWNYDAHFNGKFSCVSEDYIQSLIQAKWCVEWPYSILDVGSAQLFFRKMLHVLGNKRAYNFDYCLSAPEDFLGLTRLYFERLMRAYAAADAHTVVMHNSFEPFNPTRSLRYFNDAKCIVVDRDPRDIYVSVQNYVPPGSHAAPAPYRPLAASPELFAQRYRIYRKIAAKTLDDPRRILRLKFEDLVLSYEKILPQIYEFLGESSSTHIGFKQFFKPAFSAGNIGLWRRHADHEAIDLIARMLPEYCINF